MSEWQTDEDYRPLSDTAFRKSGSFGYKSYFTFSVCRMLNDVSLPFNVRLKSYQGRDLSWFLEYHFISNTVIQIHSFDNNCHYNNFNSQWRHEIFLGLSRTWLGSFFTLESMLPNYQFLCVRIFPRLAFLFTEQSVDVKQEVCPHSSFHTHTENILSCCMLHKKMDIISPS